MTQSFWKPFILINAIVPLACVILIKLIPVPIAAGFYIGLAIVILIQMANIALWRQQARRWKLILGIMILNVLAFFAIGAFSFFTMIPDLPFLIKSIAALITEHI